LAKNFFSVKSGFNEPDFTFRLIDINTSLLLFSLPLGCLFSVDVVGDDALHRPDMFTLPTDVGRIINQVYGCDSAEGFHFLLVLVGAIHELPAVLTFATLSQGVIHEFVVPLPLGCLFSVRPENRRKDALKSTYGSLDNHSLMPTHSQ